MIRLPGKTWWCALALAGCAAPAFGADHITLKNGFDLVCDHRVADGERVRLYLDADGTNFVEVSAAEIVAEEQVDLPRAVTRKPASTPAATKQAEEKLTQEELHRMLSRAGAAHDLDENLLASIIRQESGGHTRAMSRTGAQGLMQLMPKTAADLGVRNSFAPEENIAGGTAYLDALLRRYHDDLKLALAAYNAGPAAVDRWHGIPPYRETRAYVARVIHEYNRRWALAPSTALRAGAALPQRQNAEARASE